MYAKSTLDAYYYFKKYVVGYFGQQYYVGLLIKVQSNKWFLMLRKVMPTFLRMHFYV